MHPQSREDARPAGSALDTLDERFARGEIDKAEYLEKKQLISQRASVPKADSGEQGLDAAKSPPVPVKTPPPVKTPHARRR
jgi:hypothetical protein